MTADEIVACARQAREYGYGTVVLQAGEDYGIKTDWLADVVRRIKAETGLTITLSMGERPDDDLRRLARGRRRPLPAALRDLRRRALPADPPDLPGSAPTASPSCVGSASWATRPAAASWSASPARPTPASPTTSTCSASIDLDMIGVGPYLAHPATPLGGRSSSGAQAATRDLPADQIPNDELTDCKVVALTRLALPRRQPTRDHGAGDDQQDGRPRTGLQRGANVVMPNLTPPEYREQVRDLPREGRRARDGRGHQREHPAAALVARPHRRRRRRGPRRPARRRPAPAARRTGGAAPAGAPPDPRLLVAPPAGTAAAARSAGRACTPCRPWVLGRRDAHGLQDRRHDVDQPEPAQFTHLRLQRRVVEHHRDALDVLLRAAVVAERAVAGAVGRAGPTTSAEPDQAMVFTSSWPCCAHQPSSGSVILVRGR